MPPRPLNLLLALLLAALLTPLRAATPEPTPTSPTPPARPIPQIAHVLILSVDGLRPDLLLRANTPHMHALFQSGAYTFWARTTAMSITLPSHTSMLTGVTPEKHQVTWNDDLPPNQPRFPTVPTLFQLARKNHYTTALAAGKSKFAPLAAPDALTWQFLPPASQSATDDQVTAHAVDIITNHQPDVLFVHLPSTDTVGHAKGWGSPEQIAAIENADTDLAKILDALTTTHRLDSTLIILTADHGGAALTHGPNDARSRHIPWIATGPNVQKNLDLTTLPALTVNTEDTFATAAYVLGLPLDPNLDGKPLTQIFEKPPATAPVEK